MGLERKVFLQESLQTVFSITSRKGVLENLAENDTLPWNPKKKVQFCFWIWTQIWTQSGFICRYKSFLHVTIPRGRDWRVGDLTKFYQTRLCPKVITLSFLYKTFLEKVILSYTYTFIAASSLKPLSYIYSGPITSLFAD